ncbi:MAG: patatin-like phospholipase family protein [Alphaproteobacteria bacterium]|nr:patatin-like phospholipase family protein [Alphaproteobacteria bacterium]
MLLSTSSLVMPERLRALVPKLPLFNGMSARDVQKMMKELDWFSLPGGWTLMRRGDVGDSLYIVTAGSLGLYLPDAAGRDYLAGQIGPGDMVGEVSVLTGEPRTATLIALRDSELLRMPRAVFERMSQRYPVMLRNLARAVADRLKEVMDGRRDPRRTRATVRTIALMRLQRDLPLGEIAEALATTLSRGGRHVIILDKADREADTEWFHNIEAENDHVLYLGSLDDEHWTRLCLRQADRVMLIGYPDHPPQDLLPIEDMLSRGPRRYIELVLVHAANAERGSGAAPWVARLKPHFHHNLRAGNAGDLARLARHVSGRAVGLVLAGGGARGFAHLGVIAALMEKGVVFDLVGGTSMGAIIGAGLALDWSPDELNARMRSSFVETNPIDDYTVPLVSFIKGRKIVKLLQDNFGDARIEETWRPFFCVSSNLTAGREYIHRAGLIWQALRASVAIPGVIPPVVQEGEILVDGAVMENFPVGIMADLGRGPVIGVDLEAHHVFARQLKAWSKGPKWGVLGETMKGGPGIVSLLMRAGTVNSETQTIRNHARADLILSPPVEEIGIRAWRTFDGAVETGYKHTMEMLEDVDLTPYRG